MIFFSCIRGQRVDGVIFFYNEKPRVEKPPDVSRLFRGLGLGEKGQARSPSIMRENRSFMEKLEKAARA